MKKKEWEKLKKIICEFTQKQNTGNSINLEDDVIRVCIPGRVFKGRFFNDSFIEVNFVYEKRGGILRCYTSSIQFLTSQEKENLIQHLIA